MGSSLILKGGASVPRTVQETITRSNSFVTGDVVRFDPAAGPQGTWYKSQANSADNAEVVGVVLSASASSFDVVYGGYLQLSAFSGVSAPVLFLDSVVPGGLTTNPPSAIGSVVKPVLTRTTTAGGYVVTNYLGTQIGGSSTISVDEIQPVGTIMPFAGTAIPDTWLECNGASYAVGDYPELYAKLQASSGDRTPLYGYIATLNGTNISTVLAAGDYIQFKTNTGAWTGSGVFSTTNADVLAIVLSVTSTTAVVQVIPIYSGTNKNFTVSSTIPTGGGFVGSELGTGNYRAYGSNGTTFKLISLTITSVSLTHFNTPDLRGRFALGTNTTAIGELESDGAFFSSISGVYPLASEGGQEFTIANAGMATGTSAYTTTTTVSSGSLPNMPPYLAVRYIIKAKPYTRAAIIDDIDIPYSQLLITDLRTRNIGGSNADLVFKTNRDGDTGLGTEEMRLSGTTGRLTLHENNGTYDVSISGYGQNCLNVSSPLGGTVVLTDSDTTAAGQYRNRWISNQDGILLFGRASDDGTSPTTQMQIDYTGDVGIGVSSVSIGGNIRTLDVAGSVGGCIRLRGTASDPVGSAYYVTTLEAYAGTLSNHPLIVTTNNVERMRITPQGYVGIGTASPVSLVTGISGGVSNIATFGRNTVNSLTTGCGGGDYAGIGYNVEFTETGNTFKYRGADRASLLRWNNGGFQFFGTSTTGSAAASLTLTEFLTIASTGNVGIGVAPDTTNRLKVSGKILATDDITAFSDARYKTDVLPISNAVNKVCALNGVMYTDTNGNRKTGLLAQDVQSVLPEAVSADSDGKLALAYGNLAGLLVEAVKELVVQINQLKEG